MIRIFGNGRFRMKCRICRDIECERILDLGFHPLADTFVTEQQLSQPEVFYPLNIQICPNCGLVQSGFVVSEYERYQKNPYSYDSSSSHTAQQHFGSLAKRASTVFVLRRLLAAFRRQGLCLFQSARFYSPLPTYDLSRQAIGSRTVSNCLPSA